MKVSVVVPFLNEEDGIRDVLEGLAAQSYLPDEVVLVDAGSTDASVMIIQDWAARHSIFNVSILSHPGALPGAGRNLGVGHARNEWVAFLDAGIRPTTHWLKKLVSEVGRDRLGAWGCCRCLASGTAGTLTAAYSLGQGSLASYVIPASLFNKSVFNKIGFFREDIRAGEDILWRIAYFRSFGKPNCVIEAEVVYTRFPKSIFSAYKKWALYSHHMRLAGLGHGQTVLYFSFFISLIGGLFVSPLGSGGLFVAYLFLRGVWDPYRRSEKKIWWGENRVLFFLGPLFVLGLDTAKAIGFLQGFFPFRKTPAIIPNL